MSAATLPQAPAPATGAPSTFDAMKQGALQTVNWMGRQIQILGSTIKEYAMKIVEWAKPFFQNIATMLGETFDKVKEFALANKEVSIAVGIAIPVIAAAAIGAYFLVSGEGSSAAPANS